MYLPTDLATIFSLMRDKARSSRDFWASPIMASPIMADVKPDVREKAVAQYGAEVLFLSTLLASL